MNAQHDHGSHLFLVRFWSGGGQEAKDGQEAPVGRDHKAWSGRVQHVLSGEARTFHDWATLIELLLEMAETDGLRPSSSGPGVAQGGGARIQEAAP